LLTQFASVEVDWAQGSEPGVIDAESLLFQLRDVGGNVLDLLAAQRQVRHDGVRQAQKTGDLFDIDFFRVGYGLKGSRAVGVTLSTGYRVAWRAPPLRQQPAIFDILRKRRLSCCEQQACGGAEQVNALIRIKPRRTGPLPLRYFG
jgi:hypothetical protein